MKRTRTLRIWGGFWLLLLAGMAGHVGVVHIFVDDLGPKGQQAVDDLGDGLFIASTIPAICPGVFPAP